MCNYKYEHAAGSNCGSTYWVSSTTCESSSGGGTGGSATGGSSGPGVRVEEAVIQVMEVAPP